MNYFNKNIRWTKSDADGEVEETIDYVDSDYGQWFK